MFVLPPEDLFTLYFSKLTSSPDVSTTVALSKLVSISPWLGSVMQAKWIVGGDDTFPFAAQRLVLLVTGDINSDAAGTAVSRVLVSVNRLGGLTDAGNTSQPAVAVNMTVNGTWGVASKPMFMSEYGALALPYGSGPGLDAGDRLLLRFNQPVARIAISNKAAIDVLLVILPSGWAVNYTGAWVDDTSLLITATQ